MNVEQASKQVMRKPTRLRNGEGRCRWFQGSDLDPTSGSAGVVATACLQRKLNATRKPQRWRRVTANRLPAKDRPGRVG